MRARASAISAALLAVTIATVTDAQADDKSTGATSATFSALPSGTVLVPPKAKAPASIPANEKVAGFALAGRKGRQDYISVVSSAKIAKQLTDGTRDESSLAGEACFAEDSQNQMRSRFDETTDQPRAWRPDLQPVLTLSSSMRSGTRPTVTAVHSERVAEEGGKVSLELIDAWVDPNTRGVRLIGRSTVPLELVSTLLGGTKLYAAREAQNVLVVLVTPKVHRSTGQGVFATVDNTVFQTSCDHMRATLKTEKGQGQTVSFISNVELASVEKEPEPKPDAPSLGRPHTEMRVRPIHLHASVTWPTREKEPLLSVSAGWDSRERTAVVF
jgi:hypothetical protein